MGHLTRPAGVGDPQLRFPPFRASRPLLGVVCGMKAEAVALGRWRDDRRVQVAVSAGRADRAEAAAARMAADGVQALVSWGISGGLDPALACGTLMLPDGVVVPGGLPVAFDPRLVADCRRAAGIASAGTAGGLPRGMAGSVLVAGSDAILFTPAEKAALRKRTGAAAVDMESHCIAAAARGARIPALSIRIVSDVAATRLPALVAHALDTEGQPDPGAVLLGLVRRPWDLRALLATARDSRTALTALAEAAETVLPRLLTTLEARRAG